MRYPIQLSIFACLFYTIVLHAQGNSPYTDSLESLVKKVSSDTARLRILRELMLSYAQENNPEKVKEYGQHAIALAKQTKGELLLARIYHALGTAYLYLDNADSAIVALEFSRSITGREKSVDAKKLYAMSTGNLSNAYSSKGYETRALELLIGMMPVFEKTKDTLNYAITLHNIANKFINKKEYKKAYPYLQKSMELIDPISIFPNKAGFYLTMAHTMLNMDSIGRTKYFLDKAEKLLQQFPGSADWPNFYTYKADYHIKRKEFLLAENLCRKAIDHQSSFPNRNNLYNAYSTLQANYTAQNAFEKALHCADTIYRMAREDNRADFLLSSLHDLFRLSDTTGHLADAYKYLLQYSALKDSTDKEETLLKLSEMEMRYQSSMNEQQITQLQNRSKTQEILLWGAVILCLLLLLFFVYWFRIRQQRVRQQLQSIHQQKQIEVRQALLNGEEAERRRLARDLHDGLGGMLAGVKMNLSQLTVNAPAPLQPELNKTVQQLGDSVKELRHIARNMMPESLLRSGLKGALKDLCETYITPHLKIVYRVFDINEKIVPQQKLIIYRMIQEILNNAVNHAGADRILIQCTQAENTFFITIEDNGHGFDVKKDYEGSGLKNIQNRVDFLEGNLQIDSSAEGTIVNIEIHVTIE